MINIYSIYDTDINIAFDLEKQGILCCTSRGFQITASAVFFSTVI